MSGPVAYPLEPAGDTPGAGVATNPVRPAVGREISPRRFRFALARQENVGAGREVARLFRVRSVTAGLLAACLLWVGSGSSLNAAEPRKPNLIPLLEGLKSGDKTERREASYRLSQLGADAKAAVPDLIKALEDSEDQVWFNSITALARIGPAATEAIPALLRQLERSHSGRYREQVWYRAAFALGSVGRAALPELIKALESEHPHVRSGAAKAISWIGADATEAIPLLAKNLADAEANVREQSAEALGKIGPTALPRLKESLRNDQAPVRAGAALALQWLGEPARVANPDLAAALTAETDDSTKARFIQTLSRLKFEPAEFLNLIVPLLNSDSEPVRQEAANALILMEPAATTSVPVLRKLVAANDPATIRSAASFLGAIGTDAGVAVPDLITVRARPETDGELAEALEKSLIQIGPPAVPELVKAMNAAQGDSNHWSVRCLRDLGPVAVPFLITALESTDTARQRDALQVLTLVGDAAEPAIPQLARLAESGAAELRGPAIVALAAAGARPENVLPLAEQAMADSSVTRRRSGAAALASLGARAQPARATLINGLKDPDSTVAASSARALGRFGNAAAPAVEPLLTALARPELPVREAVVRSLGELGETAQAAVPALAKLLTETPPPLQTTAAGALGAMGAAGREALPQLEQTFTSQDPAVRAVAVAAIARVESDNGRKVDFLQRALDDPESVVRVAAIDELGAMGRAAEPAAEKLYALTEKSGERDQALEVLAGLRIRSVPLLVKATTNSDAYVRQFAIERLGQLGKAAQEAVPELRKLLQSEPEDFVKRAARSAIQEIERAN